MRSHEMTVISPCYRFGGRAFELASIEKGRSQVAGRMRTDDGLYEGTELTECVSTILRANVTVLSGDVTATSDSFSLSRAPVSR